MFNQNEGDKKLDWMYKGATSLVDREDYLLGRSIDRTLEQLNAEEKLKEQGCIVAQPKNHVEHECIPPSIRDYKLQQALAEQVDLQAKLQEDPLLAIKKREEETRRQFLQNPVQLKKLQKALSKQDKKSRKKTKDLDESIVEKLKVLQRSAFNIDDNYVETTRRNDGKRGRKERDLDIILMHKFNAMKSKLTERDLKDIMEGKISDSDDSSSDEDNRKSKRSMKKKQSRSSSSSSDRNKSRKLKAKRKKRDKSSSDSDNCGKTSKSRSNRTRDRNSRRKKSRSHSPEEKLRNRPRKRSLSQETLTHFRNRSNSREKDNKPRIVGPQRPPESYSNRYNSDDEDASAEIRNWGLVKSDGTKLPLTRRSRSGSRSRVMKMKQTNSQIGKSETRKYKKMSSHEKDQVLREMMRNAADRDVERARNMKKHREDEAREESTKEFNANFAQKEYMKSANSSTVESRIKANLNNIQRHKSAMDSHFSRRH